MHTNESTLQGAVRGEFHLIAPQLQFSHGDRLNASPNEYSHTRDNIYVPQTLSRCAVDEGKSPVGNDHT
jgi:hypothetical protein